VQRTVQGGTTRENNTLHIMDNQQRITLVRVGDPFPDDTTPAIKYQLGDHLGSSNVVMDDTGAWIDREEYTPYGETSFGSFAKKRYRFTGKERDEESGLYYHGARYYAPWVARWVSCDPAGMVNRVNLFQYSHNNPIGYRDDSGLNESNVTFPGFNIETVPDPDRNSTSNYTKFVTTVTESETSLQGGLRTSYNPGTATLTLNSAVNPWSGTGKAPSLMGRLLNQHLSLHSVEPNQIGNLRLDTVIEERSIKAMQQGATFQETVMHRLVQRQAKSMGLSLTLQGKPELAPAPPGAKFSGPYVPIVNYTVNSLWQRASNGLWQQASSLASSLGKAMLSTFVPGYDQIVLEGMVRSLLARVSWA